MKPSEMSNEELADHMWDAWRGFINDRCINSKEVDEEEALQEEAYARLRNSIPKPVVGYQSGEYTSGIVSYVVTINGRVVMAFAKESHADQLHADLATALGINDTEGGS